MNTALNKDFLSQVYNRKSKSYDSYHGWVTFHSDQKGRELLVEHAVASGNTVLDAGGGTGSTALLAAKKVGMEGKVTILDLSQGMLDVARERATAQNLDKQLEFMKGDIDELPFQENTFDVVLSTYSACPLGDPAAGALELLRVVKPGGLLGMAHSVAPKGICAKAIGNSIESIAWRFPSISLGCRAVEILPSLLKKGVTVELDQRVGPAFMPFQVFIVRKKHLINS